MASLSRSSTTIASLVIAALPISAQSSTTHTNQHHRQITNTQPWYTEQPRKMCLVESFNFKKCPCKLTRRNLCKDHLEKQKLAKYKTKKSLFLPIHTYSLANEREDKPDAVIDLEGCLKFHEQPIEEVDGYCGMAESGCPYVGKESKERLLSDDLLEWKGGEHLGHSGIVLGEGGIVEEPESYGDEGGMGEWEEEEEGGDMGIKRDWNGEGSDIMSSVRRSSLHEETQRKRKGSLHIDTRGGGIPQDTLSSSMYKPLPPPPVVVVSPEPVHMDPRHALATIPDEEDGELARPRSESLEETDPRILFHDSMGFTNS
ncbi:hypothetical protein HYFRA_00009414 [Hymenoscyphus fraxineus]|uniref:Uncharacterized protein n=1 Tax=Hymenoscyphus fraxineus TaxID=746836 RepID=A0A9N9L445_9HELO|nr:hypothetical protein HYFRA_00009414 [Hymenoscyphus fraxineus]